MQNYDIPLNVLTSQTFSKGSKILVFNFKNSNFKHNLCHVLLPNLYYLF